MSPVPEPCGEPIVITGDVVIGEVEIKNDVGNPVPVSGVVVVGNDPSHLEDTSHVSGDRGDFILGVRNDAGAMTTTANGDYSAFATDAAGRIGVANLGVDLDVSVTNFPAVQPVNGTVNVGTMPEVEVKNDIGNPLAISGSVSINAASDASKVEDAAHTSGDRGEFILGVRNDGAASLTSTDGDYSPVATDAAGRIGISDLGGSVTVDAVSLPLPTGASTAALQTAGNNSLAGIDAGVPAALGQAAAASSMPVVLASDQSPVPVTGSFTPANDPTRVEDVPHVSGDRGDFVLGVRNDAAATLTSNDGDYSALATDAAGRVGITDLGGSVTVDAVSLPLPAGAATSALQTSGNASLTSIDAGVPNALGAATTASSMPVNIASDQTVPVSATTLPLPTGASTSANQATGNASLASIDAGVPNALGAAVTANSMPVTIASDQTVPVSAATLPLPTGASTAANQATGNASLASIDAGIPAALGSAVSASSMPVVIASDQGAISVTLAAANDASKVEDAAASTGDRGNFILAVRNDAATVVTSADGDYSQISVDSAGRQKVIVDTLPATSPTLANQAAIAASLVSIDGGTPAALGQTTMAASMPVVIASNQSTLPISGTVTASNIASAMDSGSVTIGATAAQIVVGSTPAAVGVLIKTSPNNTGTIYIGPSTVTAGTATATDGIPLQAGESITLPVNDANKIYGFASAAGQILYFIAL